MLKESTKKNIMRGFAVFVIFVTVLGLIGPFLNS
jgi:hypothetical protein